MTMDFQGYRRPDGGIGIRNHVLILPASICASDTARMVAERLPAAVTFSNQNGCSQFPEDQRLTMDTMVGFAANPNVYGTVVISLGCENCQMDLVAGEIRARTNKPLETFIIQQCGGTVRTVELATRAAMDMILDASGLQREPFPISELILGTECGGSDPTSGLAANPVLGEACDHLVAMGGTAILSETSEFVGAEHILAARARDEQVRDRILGIVKGMEDYFAMFGVNIRQGNPSPGNIAAGISTLEEKSLGCIHKGGHAVIQAVYDYAKPVDQKGLVIMDTPANDPSSVAGMVAGGAQVVVFTTGLGTPTANPVAPVLKITGNHATFQRMQDNIDFDAGDLVYDKQTLQALGIQLMQEIVDVANGKLTKSEVLGFYETTMPRLSNFA